MRAHDADRRVRVMPNQTPGVRAALRLSKAEVDRAAWVVTRAGERFEGAAVVQRVLTVLPRWRWLARGYALPPVRFLAEIVYRWIVTHRRRLSFWGVTPECLRPGVSCVPEGE